MSVPRYAEDYFAFLFSNWREVQMAIPDQSPSATQEKVWEMWQHLGETLDPPIQEPSFLIGTPVEESTVLASNPPKTKPPETNPTKANPSKTNPTKSKYQETNPSKRKKVKDPNAPKQPTCAYFFFAKEHRLEVTRQSQNSKEAMSVLGRVWKELDVTERAPYIAKAEESKTLYKKEMEEYRLRNSEKEQTSGRFCLGGKGITGAGCSKTGTSRHIQTQFEAIKSVQTPMSQSSGPDSEDDPSMKITDLKTGKADSEDFDASDEE